MAKLRGHAAFLILLGVGLVLRVLILVAYPQAFWFPDSSRYLQYSSGWRIDWLRQAGYSMLLKVLRQTGTLYSVSVLQHLLGLAVAVGIYALIVRRGLPRWLGVIAAAPVVLDAYQLTVEHFVLSDILFTTLVGAGLLALLWPARASAWWTGAAGVLLAASATVRVVSLPLVIVTLGYLLIRKVGWRPVASFAAALTVILGGYVVLFHQSYGTYGFSTFGPAFLYGRVAVYADCDHLVLTDAERRLCPTLPVGQRVAKSDWYVWSPESPAYDADLDTQGSFASAVMRQQPLDTAWAVITETGSYLVPHPTPGDTICASDAMRLHAVPPAGPAYDWCQPNPRQAFASTIVPSTLPPTTPLTRALGGYADIAQTPRLVLGLSVLAILVALAWRPRRRVAGVPPSDLLLVGGWGLGLLVLVSAASGFDERYALPSLAILPAGGALALYRLFRTTGLTTVDGAGPASPRLLGAERGGGAGASGPAGRQERADDGDGEAAQAEQHQFDRAGGAPHLGHDHPL